MSSPGTICEGLSVSVAGFAAGPSLAPGESPGSHLPDLALLRLHDRDGKFLNFLPTRLFHCHPRGLNGALMVRDHGVDKRQVERRRRRAMPSAPSWCGAIMSV